MKPSPGSAAARNATSAFTPGFTIFAVLVWALAAVRLNDANTTVDPDAPMMVAGVVRGWHTGEVMNVLCYGARLQFLFYDLFHLLGKIGPGDATFALQLLNRVGAVCALAIPFLFVGLLHRSSGDGARSRLAGLLFLTSPIYLFLASSGHPLHVALAISLGAWLAFIASIEGGHGRALPLAIAAIALQSVALMLRVEQVALFIAFGAALTLGTIVRRRAFGVAATFLLVPPVLAVALGRLRVVDGPIVGTGPGFGNFMTLLARAADVARLRWSAAHFAFEIGIALVLLVLVIVIGCLRRRDGRVLAIGLAATLPTLAVYLGNPRPPRHFLVAALGIAWLVAFGPAAWRPAVARIAVPLCLAGNLLAPWLLVPLSRHDPDGRSPLSFNMLERVERSRASVDAARALVPEILAPRNGRTLVVFGTWVQVSLLSAELAARPALAVERFRLPNSVRPFVFTSPGSRIVLVEATEPDLALRVRDDLRARYPDLLCVSLATPDSRLDDLHLSLPARLAWWSI